jgi:hypothetical protein
MTRPISPAALGLPGKAAGALESAGFNLAGCIAAEAYDAIVPAGWRSDLLLPGARSAILLGTGGRALERAMQVAREPVDPDDPVDRFVGRAVSALVAALCAAGHETRSFSYAERRASDGAPSDAGSFVSMVALARAAGLGVTGRLGILLNPEYGPWFAVRVLLLSGLELQATVPDPEFDPCTGCPAPCADACLGGAFPRGNLDLPLCFDARERIEACGTGCASRRACVLGQGHVYGAEREAYFSRRTLESARRWRGDRSGA